MKLSTLTADLRANTDQEIRSVRRRVLGEIGKPPYDWSGHPRTFGLFTFGYNCFIFASMRQEAPFL